MSNIQLKEFKYIQCFRSDRDGWCNYCNTRTWKKGYKIYWMEKPNGDGWAACTDRKCYLEQGGTLTLFKGDYIPTVQKVELKKEPAKIQLEMKSDHDLVLMLLAKVSILEHVVEGLVRK